MTVFKTTYQGESAKEVGELEERIKLLEEYVRPNYNGASWAADNTIPILVSYEPSESRKYMVLIKPREEGQPLTGLGLIKPAGSDSEINE